MGKPLVLKKEEKVEKAWLGLCEKSSQWAQKEIGPGYLGDTTTREGILRKCKKELVGSWIAQGNMLMDIRNEQRHVPSAAYNSKEKALETNDDLRTSTWWREA